MLMVAAAVGYGWGRMSAPGGTSKHIKPAAQATGGTKQTGFMKAVTPPQSPALERLPSLENLTDAAIGGTTFKALAEPDRARRMAAVGVLLDSMTPANAESIRQAFVDITKKTGRRHDSEWSMMMHQYGKVMGAAGWAAMQKNGTGGGDRASALEGWATMDPAAAIQAMSSMKEMDRDYFRLRSALLSGVAQKDPAMGFRLAMENPVGVDPKWLVDSGIRTLGLDGATAALQKVMDEAGDKAAENPGTTMLFHGLTDAMFHQKWISGESEKMLPWLEAQKGQPFLMESAVHHGAKDVVMQGKIELALDWLERMNAGRDRPYGIQGVVQGLQEKPALLESMDTATLERIVSMTALSDFHTARLAKAIESSYPEQAARLRALPPDPRVSTRFDPPQ